LIGASLLGIITFAAFWIVTQPTNIAVHSPSRRDASPAKPD
jgi:hypothetical protein